MEKIKLKYIGSHMENGIYEVPKNKVDSLIKTGLYEMPGEKVEPVKVKTNNNKNINVQG